MDQKKEHWTINDDKLLAEWGEKAMCYSWLFSRASNYYKKRNYALSIPTIILSSLVGAGVLLVDKDSPYERELTALLGILGIASGILSTIAEMFKYGVAGEQHRKSYIAMSSLNRIIMVQINLEPDLRVPKLEFFKEIRKEYDKIIKESGDMPDEIIDMFNKEFENRDDLSKPSITNGLEKIVIVNWYDGIDKASNTDEKESRINNLSIL